MPKSTEKVMSMIGRLYCSFVCLVELHLIISLVEEGVGI